MKLRIVIFALTIISITASAQEKLYMRYQLPLYGPITQGVLVENIDSIYFLNDGQTTVIATEDSSGYYFTYAIDSMYFGPDSRDVYVIYNGMETTIINPLEYEGVRVIVSGADVFILSDSEYQDINYHLLGTTDEGSVQLFSDKRYNLMLDGVQIFNTDGFAINLQSHKNCSLILKDGTENLLKDGFSYLTTSIGDKKAALFGEGKITISGNGQLSIIGQGLEQHALASDDEIEITSGTIVIERTARDGIHGKDGVVISGGDISITSFGDGIDGDEGSVDISGGNITMINSEDDIKGINADSTISISGGVVNITVEGNQSKGISANQSITLSGGNITINNTGDLILEASGSGFDPSYSTAIKSDGLITLNGSDVSIKTSGKGSKSISSDTGIEIITGTVNITNSGIGAKYTNETGVADAYASAALSSDGYINILGGTLTTSSTGAGGKGIKADGTFTIGGGLLEPMLNITTTGTKILVSGNGNNANYSEAKAIKANGDIWIKNGNITIASADDGIKSDTKITIDGGKILVTKSVEGIESKFIFINDGDIEVNCSDDALNSSTGAGGEGDDGSKITINGGQIVLSPTGGDGLDSNGGIEINGGTTIVHGPASSPELGIDVNGVMNMNGGFLIASGTNSNMTEGPANSSAQYSILAKSSTSISSSTLFHLQDANGNELVTFKPLRNYYSMVFSSSALVSGGSYSIYTGGAHTGTSNHGVFTGGTYSGGTLKKTFTMGNKLTNVSF